MAYETVGYCGEGLACTPGSGMITNMEIGVPMVVHGMTRGKKERGSNKERNDQGPD